MNTKKAEALKKSAAAIAEFEEKLRKTKEVFPKVDIIYSAVGVFGEDTYNRVIMAYKDPELTKLLADYFEELVGHKFSGEDILSLYVGIGDTDKIRKEYADVYTPPERQSTKYKDYRRGPNGVHRNILGRLGASIGITTTSYLCYTYIPDRFRYVFSGVANNAHNLVEAYIKGDRQAMFEALPTSIRVKHNHNIANDPQAMAELPFEERIKYVPDAVKELNVPDGISADDLHRIGKWLTEIHGITRKMNMNRHPSLRCEIVGKWLQETFPAAEITSQNTAITSAIKDAKSNKR